MRLQKFKHKVYLILTNRRSNYRMYHVYKVEEEWRITVETEEDKDLVLSALGEDGKCYRHFTLPHVGIEKVREFHRSGYTGFCSVIITDKEPGLEFHREMKKQGLTRVYQIYEITEIWE